MHLINHSQFATSDACLLSPLLQSICRAGGVYNFDDITQDGSLPTRFLGLIWSGLRVTNSQRFTACEGVSGFRYGIVSAPNVAYSLEVGASGDLTNLVRITAPSTALKISVLGFTATAAWQVRVQETHCACACAHLA